MLINIFSILIFSGLFILFLGFKYDIVFRMLGFLIIFLVGFAAISGIEYQTGADINTTYTYVGDQVVGSSNDVVKIYETYETRSIGYFTAIVAAMGFIYSLIDIRNNRKEDD